MTESEILTLANVRIVEPSFSGKGDHKTTPGTRAFSVVLTEELASELKDKGFFIHRAHVTKFEPPAPVLRVNLPGKTEQMEYIKHNGRELDLNSMLGFLDHEPALTATLKIRAYPWYVNDRVFGIKCYLLSMESSMF